MDRRTNDTPEGLTLDALRRRIDALDDRLHDLLMERAEIVGLVARQKRADKLPPFRPGREAQVLRRLVARHRGRFPGAALVRIWREIMGGSIAMQTDLAVALGPGCGALAREHFGGEFRMIDLPSAAESIATVRTGGAGVGVVALEDADKARPWWLMLADLPDPERPRVVARLPFGASAAAARGAFVLAPMAPEASGDDCTLYVVRATLPPARIADALMRVGLDCTPLAEAGGAAQLVAVDVLLGEEDPRVERALAPLGHGVAATWLGAYARPLPAAALRGATPE